jgi:signal transduction histidine kinase
MLEILNLEDPETYANEYVQYLKKGTDNLQKTIEHLTEVVKNSYLENDELKILPLKPIIDRTIDSLISTSEKNKVQLINLVNDALYVRAIPAYLDSIIMNFMTNAIKYADLNKKSTLKISSWKVDNETVIQFLDNGLGIDLDKYGKHLFDLYKTFHNKSDSRGIGLHITKNQIEAMGGRIEVESKVGKGTTFRVYLKN